MTRSLFTPCFSFAESTCTAYFGISVVSGHYTAAAVAVVACFAATALTIRASRTSR